MLEGALLQAVIEAPEDDGPRLVLADWLEEHGQPERAEFVRTQVELARLEEWGPRRYDLAAREREFLAAHEAEWRRALPAFKGVRWGAFERGLVGSVEAEGWDVFRRRGR